MIVIRKGSNLPRAELTALSRDALACQSPHMNNRDEDLVKVRDVRRGYDPTYRLPKDLTTHGLATCLKLDLTAARGVSVDLTSGPYISRHSSQETRGWLEERTTARSSKMPIDPRA